MFYRHLQLWTKCLRRRIPKITSPNQCQSRTSGADKTFGRTKSVPYAGTAYDESQFRTDDVQMEWIIKEFLKMEGIHYVRSNRKAVRNVYKKGSSFKIGQGNILKEGKDILIIAAGQLVSEALDCAEELEKEGYSVEVIDMFTIKPLDEKLLIKEAKGKSKIVTIENHSIYGGLGSAVSEVIAENGISVPVKRIGVKEKFGQVGTAEFLQEEFGLTAKQIKETICQF